MERGPISASKLHPKKNLSEKNNRKNPSGKIYIFENFSFLKKKSESKLFFSKLRFFCRFFFEVEIFQKCHFQKYFFFGWIFSTIFFSLRIFWGCSFEAENGPLSIYGVFRAIAALLHPVWSKFRIWCHFH